MSLFTVSVYRNIYVKGYNRFPYQKLTGRGDLVYTGEIVCGVDCIPEEFDRKKDLYISCDCDFPRWRRVVKIKSKNKK